MGWGYSKGGGALVGGTCGHYRSSGFRYHGHYIVKFRRLCLL